MRSRTTGTRAWRSYNHSASIRQHPSTPHTPSPVSHSGRAQWDKRASLCRGRDGSVVEHGTRRAPASGTASHITRPQSINALPSVLRCCQLSSLLAGSCGSLAARHRVASRSRQSQRGRSAAFRCAHHGMHNQRRSEMSSTTGTKRNDTARWPSDRTQREVSIGRLLVRARD